MRIIHPDESVPALSLYHTATAEAGGVLVTDSRTGETVEWPYPDEPGPALLVTGSGELVGVVWGHPLHGRVLRAGGAVEASIRGDE